MKLPQFLNRKTYGNERPRAPQALLYVPPSGAPVHCPDVETAQQSATQFAAENPGRTVAVYQLVGYAFRPVEAPEFTPATSDKAKADLLDCAPSDFKSDWPVEGDDPVDRSDLSPEQRETLARIHEATRNDGE